MRWALAAGLVLYATAAALAAEDSRPRGGQDGSLDVSLLGKPPRLIHKATPEFPRSALDKRAEAEIKVVVDVDDKGQVTGATVWEPKQPTGLGFEDAAVVASYQLEFEPAEIDGKPVAVQILYTFKFALPKRETAVAEPAPGVGQVAKAPPTIAPIESFAGVLRERGTRTPMAGILVTVYRDDQSPPVGFECLSDAAGHFSFFDLSPGLWKISIEAPGYFPFNTTEEMRTGESVQVRYFVERKSYNPFDVLVESPRPHKEVSRVIIASEIIEKVPGAMGDALSAVQNYAGVARAQAYSSDIIVRGSAPEDTKVFVDGVEIPIAYHFSGWRSVLPTGMIDSLDFYPGNFSSYYGRATGGVIDVSLKKPDSQRWKGYVDVNLLDSGFFLQAPVTPKLTLSAAARRSYMDTFLSAVISEDASFRMTQAPVYYDYQFLADYRPAPAHDLRLFVFGSDDRMALLYKNATSLGAEINGNRYDESTHFERVVAGYRYVPGEHFENVFRVAVGRDREDEVVGQFFEHIRMDSLQLRDTARVRLAKPLTLVTGVDGILQHWTGNVLMPKSTRDGNSDSDIDLTHPLETTVDENHWLPGAFAGLDIQASHKLLLLPSLRFDYYSKIKDATIAPRLSVRYAVNDALTLKGGVGVYHQEPTIDESNEAFGNPLLKAERAIHYSAGFELKALPLSVDLTGFYKDLDHQVSETSATRIENGQQIPLRYDNQGVGRVYGMELVLRREPSHRLSGWLAYTLSRSDRRDPGASGYRLFQYDQTHILTAVAMLRFGHNWQLGSRFRLASGNPFTPVVGAVIDLDSDVYKPTYGAKNSDRNPMFMQWDLRIDKTWVFDRFLLDAYLDVQNVTDRANVDESGYSLDYRTMKASTALPLYPILGLRVEM